ncbi:MAG: META domain-containing protein [Rhizobacter sp.]|nr:META domain-containing protein [Ferruginibacter sp.]
MKKLFYLAAVLFVGLQACNPTKNAGADTKAGGLTDTYWKLTELNGKAIGEANAGRREVYVILRKQDTRVQGNAGCNGYGGTYTLDPNGFNIKFSAMMHTQMACPGLDVENEFLKVFETADSYYVKDGMLQLNRARMAPLAKFVAVAGKADSMN